MRFVTATAAAFALMSASAPSAMAADITGFTADNVKALVTEAGGTNVSSETIQGGTTMVSFEMNQLPFSYTLQICNQKGMTGCAGLLMAIGVETDQAVGLDILNSFNRDIPVVTLVQLDAKTIAFGRFVVAIGGISSDNFKANMGMVAVGPELFVRHLKSQVVASSGQGAATTISAPTQPTTTKAVRLSQKAMGRMLNEDVLKSLK